MRNTRLDPKPVGRWVTVVRGRALIALVLAIGIVVVPPALAGGRPLGGGGSGSGSGSGGNGTAPDGNTVSGVTRHGTSGSDRMIGTDRADRLYGEAGDDQINGMGGNDELYGGRGADTVNGGAGNDQITATDGVVDTISCGAGRDTVTVDRTDRVNRNCETRRFGSAGDNGSGGGSGGTGGGTGGSTPPPSGGSSGGGNSIVRVNEPWTCTGPVNLDLVKITMRTAASDGIYLRQNCSGRIGRIEVATWTGDGLKVNAPAPVAHDLVIEGGYIRCYGQTRGHQDGIQAMGGQRITFRNLEINCNSNPNAQLFLSASNGGHPTDIVCDGCTLGRGAAQTLFITTSTRSGARNSTICQGRYDAIRIDSPANSPVNTNNRVIPATDPRCTAPPA